MLRKLYSIAKLEGEGLGTAYEYYVKIRLIRHLLKDWPRDVLIYGLPERYGFSMDLFWLFRQSKICLYEDRMVRLNRCLELADRLRLPRPEIVSRVNRKFGLVISCEAFQRMNKDRYANTVLSNAGMALILVPNSDNKAHATSTGLKGCTLKELEGHFQAKGGYIDMPPFSPGIRMKGKPGNLHFYILQSWAHLEPFLPYRKRVAHICYVFKPASCH